MRRLIAALALAAVAVFAGSCSQEKAVRAPCPAGKLCLELGNQADPVSLDPQKITGTAEDRIVGDLQMGLTQADPEGRPIPGVATSWETSARRQDLDLPPAPRRDVVGRRAGHRRRLRFRPAPPADARRPASQYASILMYRDQERPGGERRQAAADRRWACGRSIRARWRSRWSTPRRSCLRSPSTRPCTRRPGMWSSAGARPGPSRPIMSATARSGWSSGGWATICAWTRTRCFWNAASGLPRPGQLRHADQRTPPRPNAGCGAGSWTPTT